MPYNQTACLAQRIDVLVALHARFTYRLRAKLVLGMYCEHSRKELASELLYRIRPGNCTDIV